MGQSVVKFEITAKYPNRHIFEVVLNITHPNPLGQVFQLPSWIPGSYLIRDFSKHIIDLEANNGVLQSKKIDKNHWIVEPTDSELTLNYSIYAFDPSVRSAYLSAERGFFNGSSVFLLPLGYDNADFEIKINLPEKELVIGNWSIATSMPLVENKSNTFIVKGYHELIDHPVELADFTAFNFSTEKVNYQMALSGKHEANLESLTADLAAICLHHENFFKEPATKNYLFLNYVKSKGYGGLEHNHSCALISSREDLVKIKDGKLNPNYIKFLALCAHEYFHTWWVKRVKPKEFHNPDLTREVHTNQLWIFEGFTSYYDELTLLRAKLVSLEEYLTLFSTNITRYFKSKGRYRQTLVQSSFDAWTKFYQQDENAPNAIVSYYNNGALLAFCLDILIRTNKKNRMSLDTIVKNIWSHYKSVGTEDDCIQKEIKKIDTRNYQDFFDNYLLGKKDLPIKESLNYLGIKLSLENKMTDLESFGMNIDDSGFVKTIYDDSCVQEYGIYVGDKIISMNYEEKTPRELVSGIYSINDGEIIKFGIIRDSLLMEIPVKKYLLEPFHAKLEIIKDISKEQKENLNHWITG